MSDMRENAAEKTPEERHSASLLALSAEVNDEENRIDSDVEEIDQIHPDINAAGSVADFPEGRRNGELERLSQLREQGEPGAIPVEGPRGYRLDDEISEEQSSSDSSQEYGEEHTANLPASRERTTVSSLSERHQQTQILQNVVLEAHLVDETAEARQMRELQDQVNRMQLERETLPSAHIVTEHSWFGSIKVYSQNHPLRMSVLVLFVLMLIVGSILVVIFLLDDDSQDGANDTELRESSRIYAFRPSIAHRPVCLVVSVLCLIITASMAPSRAPSPIVSKFPSMAPSLEPTVPPSDGIWFQLGRDLKGNAPQDGFGSSMSLLSWNNTLFLAVGAPFQRDQKTSTGLALSGSIGIYTLVRIPTVRWELLGPPLQAPDGSFLLLGRSVALSSYSAAAKNDTLIVAGSAAAINPANGTTYYTGKVIVWEYQSSARTWKSIDIELALSAQTKQEDVPVFVQSVALSEDGKTLAASALRNTEDRSLVVCIFRNNANKWEQIESVLLGTRGNAEFDTSLAFSRYGTIIAIGSSSNSFVKVFQYSSSGTWSQLGLDLVGVEQEGDRFGHSISLSADGMTLAVGSPFRNTDEDEDKILQGSGQVRVIRYNPQTNSWDPLGLPLTGKASHSRFGESVALSSDGSVLAVGAIWHNGKKGANSGQVRVFAFDPDTRDWKPSGHDLDGTASEDRFGKSVVLSDDGSVVAASSLWSGQHAGQVRVFERESSSN